MKRDTKMLKEFYKHIKDKLLICIYDYGLSDEVGAYRCPTNKEVGELIREFKKEFDKSQKKVRVEFTLIYGCTEDDRREEVVIKEFDNKELAKAFISGVELVIDVEAIRIKFF